MSSVSKSSKFAESLASSLDTPSGTTISSPCIAFIIASRAISQPLPPASTTPAFFRTGFWFMVLASASSASSIAAACTNSIWLFSRAALIALAAARRATVRMVPSAGFITALYAASTPSCRASAHRTPSQRSTPFSFLEIPRSNRDRITPELPRAPRSMAEAAVEDAFSRLGSSTLRRSAAAALMVMDMLVPVSPSGTGNTFRSFSCCLLISMAAAALIIILRKELPLIVCLNSTSSGSQSIIMESIYTFTARTSVPVQFLTM